MKIIIITIIAFVGGYTVQNTTENQQQKQAVIEKVTYPKVETQQIGRDIVMTPDSENPFGMTDEEKAEEAGDY
jgi:hypothetical protein